MLEKALVRNIQIGRLDRELDKKIDVYAFAITMFEIATRSQAWKGLSNDEIKTAVMSGDRPEFPPAYLDAFKKLDGFTLLIRDCWRQQESARPSFDLIPTTLLSLGEFAFDGPDDTTKSFFSRQKSTSSATNDDLQIVN